MTIAFRWSIIKIAFVLYRSSPYSQRIKHTFKKERNIDIHVR